MIVELALRGRVELEKQGMRRKGLLSRKLLCKNPANTGDVLLDEALKHIKETNPPDNIQNWIELLSGRTPLIYNSHSVTCCVHRGNMESAQSSLPNQKCKRKDSQEFGRKGSANN